MTQPGCICIPLIHGAIFVILHVGLWVKAGLCVELFSNSNPACLWGIQIALPSKIWLWGVLLLEPSSPQPTAIEIQVGIHPMVSSPIHQSWFASQSTPPQLAPYECHVD